MDTVNLVSTEMHNSMHAEKQIILGFTNTLSSVSHNFEIEPLKHQSTKHLLAIATGWIIYTCEKEAPMLNSYGYV